jgi:uncharacterized membrane protein YraQ (UPF0718 family)
MFVIYVITAVAVIASAIADRGKTAKAFAVAFGKMVRIAPAFLAMTILISIALYVVPDDAMGRYLGQENRWAGLLTACVVGSVSLIPGYIAFPLCGMLLQEGVPYMVLSGFSTTLMMVGVLTFPVERSYLGTRVAVLRNLICLVMAVVVSIVTGLFFGELTR